MNSQPRFFFPQFCNIEKLAKFSKNLEKVVEFNLEEKEKSQLLCLSKKKKETIQVFCREKHWLETIFKI